MLRNRRCVFETQPCNSGISGYQNSQCTLVLENRHRVVSISLSQCRNPTHTDTRLNTDPN